MNYLALYVFALLHFAGNTEQDNSIYPKNYFKSPLALELTLAGNFGEPRSGHFHTGCDFKTRGEQGLPVYAAADGYVSRINVSPGGYGNALYITHPNGFVTVYGHLKEFAPKLMERLRREQYAKQSFAVDFSLQPGEFKVQQGQVIAQSGNTGASGGPHLHFEIRDSLENAINPLWFGIKVEDSVAPIVHALKFYPMDKLKYKSDGYRVKTFGKSGNYEITGGVAKLNALCVGISINTYDFMNADNSSLGVYSLRMYDNGKLKYEAQMDFMSFNDTRCVLSQVDYPIFQKEEQKVFQKCFIEPGNKSPIYVQADNGGLIDLSDRKLHEIRIESADFAGNVSITRFKITADETSKAFKEKMIEYEKRFDFDQPNEYSDEDIQIKMHAFCLFDTLFFYHDSKYTTEADIYSKIHTIGNAEPQVYGSFALAIKTEKLDPKLADKAVIVYQGLNGEETSCGGKFDKGFITTRVRNLGTYYIKVDTTAPLIVPVNISNDQNMSASKKIVFKIKDNLSGIASYNTWLDNDWTVTDYDAKSSTLTYTLPQGIDAGTHFFKVSVVDERGNTAEYLTQFRI